MAKRTITNSEDFEQLMTEVDARLKADKVPIPVREIRALSLVAKMLETELRWPSRSKQPNADSYSNKDLAAHVFAWMRSRYGDRLKVDPSLGSALLLIRGDPWLVRFPLILGKVQAVWDLDLTHQYPKYVFPRPGVTAEPIKISVPRCIKDLPQTVASQLSNKEAIGIMKFFLAGHLFLHLLDRATRTDRLAAAVKIDLTDAAEHGVSGPANYGHSRWASLQAAEKILKLYLTRHGIAYDKKHVLMPLANAAVAAGLPLIDPATITAAQCSASVRYEETGITMESVVAANQAAVEIGRITMTTLSRQAHP